jgi:WD40 repeat protein
MTNVVLTLSYNEPSIRDTGRGNAYDVGKALVPSKRNRLVYSLKRTRPDYWHLICALLLFPTLPCSLIWAQDDLDDATPLPNRLQQIDYANVVQAHLARKSLSFHQKQPIAMLSWFKSKSLSTVQCEVYANGIVQSFLNSNWGSRGAGAYHLSPAEQQDLIDALARIPSSSKPVPRDNWVLVSCLRGNRWDTITYDRRALPFSVRDVFEIAGATITPPVQGQESLTLNGHRTPIVNLKFSLDGTKLFTFDAGGTVKTWSLPTGELERMVHLTAPNSEKKETRFPHSMVRVSDPYNNPTAVSSDAQLLAFGRRNPGIWDLKTGRLLGRTKFDIQNASTWCNALAFSRDGTLLAVDISSRETSGVGLWDVRLGNSVGIVSWVGNAVVSIGFSADGTTLAIGRQGRDGSILLFDVPSLEQKGNVSKVAHRPGQLLFTSDDDHFLVAGSGKLSVLDSDLTTRFVATANRSGWRPVVSLSPVGNELATSRNRNLIKIWDWRTGKRLTCLHGHTHNVTAIAHSPDGHSLATGDQSGTVRIWRPAELLRDSPPVPIIVRDGPFDAIESLMRIPASMKLDEANQVRKITFPLYHKVDSDLAFVGQLPTIEHIVLNGWETPGAGLAHLSGLKHVRIIELWSHHVTDEALPHIGKLASLEQLILRHTDITDSGLANLSELTQLKTLLLHRTSIGNDGLKNLANLRSLEVLSLHRTRVTDSGLVHLAKLTNLRDLSLAGTAIEGSGLVYLRGLRNLRTLRLWDTKVGDEALEHLRQLKQLKTLLLYETQLSKQSLRILRSELPSTKVSS